MNDKFQFKGKIVTKEKAAPWEKVSAIVQDKNGNYYNTELPIRDAIIQLILEDSNYSPSKEMASQVANVFFQTIVTPCPDSWSFSQRIENDSVLIEYRVVDKNGVLWELKIKSDNKNKEFHSRKTNIFYKDLVRF